MRRIVACLALVLAAPLGAQAQSGPPHAWLFGTWTGGLYPAPARPTAAQCLAHPTVIFTQDVVLRATLMDVIYLQREIETALTTAGSTEIRFVAAAPVGNGLLGVAAGPGAPGFGCESPDVLHVQRHGENEIIFPGCADFPNPLVRCPSP
ncbi:conserved exported protein of unknown function [Rhodovastum atsumiense]|uniref:Uncharacterized protein n=1 Tax=Rhodovastum atsumiense TaxID=504468 RepID=A0A5M6INA0_9PROT|nr:hypothetical protein [Rhodovastum atsumiense]KAA5609734.1 hypothetical protein F1189_22855 [Rhodovastum atsumiense]CAH2604505.1 conserved exported protein of unknown function [Rhodovastum atsumiense]